MRDFEKLNFWQRSHKLALSIYKVTQLFPKTELYGLVSQMRRSASSIPTNIAEGCGRESKKELRLFLSYAAGSCSELLYQLGLCKDLGYITLQKFKELSEETISIRRMIASYFDKIIIS